MELPMALRLIGLSAAFCISGTLATPIPFDSLVEGSTDEEELFNLTSSLPTIELLPDYQTTPVGPVHVEVDFLGQVVTYLEQNMLLILVAGALILIVFLIICGAVFMSRKHKVNAYYPSSFPSKMYVDHRDKTGGAKPFNEVPEKAAPEQESEPVDSHKQLQADIARAARSLRTPSKSVDTTEGSELSRKAADHRPEDSSEPDGCIPGKELQSLPEEKEPSVSEAASGICELKVPEQQQLQHPDEDDPQQPLTSRNPRPPSLHIHNDSATLQLIAGEKTAF